MHLPEPNSGGNFTPPPAGTHIAVCYRFIDLGTHPVEYKGEVKEPKRKVLLSWELSNEMMETEEGQKPFTIHQQYTWSMHEKAALRKHLESWRGKRFVEADFGPGGFDTHNLIGVPCMLSVIHSEGEKVYANLSGISGLPKGMEKPKPINQPIYLSLEKGLFDRAVFDALSDHIKDKIRSSPEWAELNRGGPAAAPGETFELDDEIPF